MTKPLRFGVFVPQGWKLEYTGWSGPDAWARSVELAQLTEQLGYDHLWVYDHVETVPRREADPLLRGVHHAGGALPADHHHRSGPARHLRLLPQRRTAGQGGGLHRRLLGRPAHPRPGGRLVRTRVRGLRLPLSGRPGPARRPRRDPRGDPASVDRGDGHLRRRAPPLRRRLLRPEAGPAASALCWWAAAARRSTCASPPATPTPPTGRWTWSPSSASRPCWPATARRSAVRPTPSTRTHGPDCRLFDTDAEARAWCAEPDGGTSGGAGRSTPTWPTTWWARPSR